jgi:hypothetical protein
MSTIQFTGGANCGLLRCSAPFARLSANRKSLVLKIPFGVYTFTPKNVVSISRESNHRLCIEHTVPSYPSHIMFLPMDYSSQDIINQIHEVGFIPSGDEKIKVSNRGLPLHWWSIATFVLLWNTSFWATPRYPQFSIFIPLPILTMSVLFATTILLMKVNALQRIVLKPGRSIREIMPLLFLLAFVSGILTFAMVIMLLSGQYASIQEKESLCRSEFLAKQAWWCMLKK